MAKKKIETSHLQPHQFKPGQSGNPGGRPPLPDELRKARKLNQIKVSEVVIKFLNMSIKELDQVIKDEETQTLEGMIAKIIAESLKYGDYSRTSFILDRGVGKLQEVIQHKLPKPTVIKLLGGEGALVLGNETQGEDEE